ncbi:hypothetical protein [Ralstonia pseudosolanacearum]|uniref:hypothetical protein n=1 Tax=Ralstonia pseudosolanacearum TaxID=1310165 RepID=UPI001E34363D|nr:hypothetical protein [Ralstonia pseudosolanacearum]
MQNSQRGIEQQRWLLPLRSKLELGFTRSPLALLPGAGQHNDGRWELWAREVMAVACDAGVHFTSGPSETFATRDEALAAGLAWRNSKQQP